MQGPNPLSCKKKKPKESYVARSNQVALFCCWIWLFTHTSWFFCSVSESPFISPGLSACTFKHAHDISSRSFIFCLTTFFAWLLIGIDTQALTYFDRELSYSSWLSLLYALLVSFFLCMPSFLVGINSGAFILFGLDIISFEIVVNTIKIG